MPVEPRVSEFVKFRNVVVGDYFAFREAQVTYREDGAIVVWTDILENVNNRMYSFEDEPEFDEHFLSIVHIVASDDSDRTISKAVCLCRQTARLA